MIEQSAGATPAVPSATPGQSSQITEEPAPPVGSEAALGEAGTRALEAERKARRDAEKAFRAARDELDQLKTAKLSAEEQKDRRLAELERKEADWAVEKASFVLRDSVTRAATRLGFVDPTDAIGLLDRASIDHDPDGTPTNVDRLLADLAKTKPYLLARSTPAPAGFDTGTGGATPVRGRTYTRDQLRDPAFFAANRDDILAASREGRIAS